ncbi:MAG: serine hydrolase [Phycisphaeraceae bacterium]
MTHLLSSTTALLLISLTLTACASNNTTRAPASTRITSGWFSDILINAPSTFGGLLADPKAHRIQILISEVVEHPDRPATLNRYRYRVDDDYIYPASAIKVAAAVAALLEVQQIAEQTGLNITADTPLVLHPRKPDGVVRTRDDSNVANGTITLHHEIRKTLLVSSNEAYNRLYDFVGRDQLNQTMWDAGLTSFRLRHRLSDPGDETYHRFTPRTDIILDQRAHTVPQRTATLPLTDNFKNLDLRLGQAHINNTGERINTPFDFSDKNHVALEDLQDLIIMIARPEIDLGKPGFQLSDTHRALILDAMSIDPLDSPNPVYPRSRYQPGFADSPVLDGVARVVTRPAVMVIDKSGTAYGFKIENGYFFDRSTGTSFFLTATTYTNPNQTLNDDTYGYQAANAFMTDLGVAIAKKLWIATERQ